MKTKKRQNQKNKERKTQQTYSNKWPMSKRTCQKTGKIDVQGCWKNKNDQKQRKRSNAHRKQKQQCAKQKQTNNRTETTNGLNNTSKYLDKVKTTQAPH